MEGWVPLGDTGSNNPNHSRLIKLPDQLDTMKKIKITIYFVYISNKTTKRLPTQSLGESS